MKKNKKGFTILETILSVAIFSALMVIVFHCWMEFQKASIKNEGKQDTNIQFVKIYRNIDKYVSSSNSRLFRYYGNFGTGGNNIKWFAFMLSRDNHQLDGKVVYRSPGNKSYKRDDDPDNELPRCMVYNTCVYYLLYQKRIIFYNNLHQYVKILLKIVLIKLFIDGLRKFQNQDFFGEMGMLIL